MEQLEALYESTPKAVGFIERKCSIPDINVNLYGPPQCGKSWLLLDYLSHIPKRKHLYIDLNDVRLDPLSLGQKLPHFIEMNGIDVVAIDHYDGSIPLPSCQQLIVVTQKPLNLPELQPLPLTTLDFEEYLAFEKRHIHLEHSFSLYLRTGSLPAMATLHETLLTRRLHQLMQTIFPSPNEQILFRRLARFLGKQVTANQLYTTIKKEHKISKDWLYRTLKAWEERQIIGWIAKFNQPRAAKRLLLYDFAMPASMYFEKSLMGQLYSIAGHKLQHQNRHIVFTEKIDFFEPSTRRAIILSPFATPQSAAEKISQRIHEIDMLKIEQITILTIANTFEFMFEEVAIKAVPFYAWMVEEEE